MASQPKRRRRTKSSAPAAISGPPPAVSPSNSIPQPNAPPTLQMEDMVQTCMSRLVPTIEDTFRQYMRDFHEQSAPPNEEPAPSLLQEITAPAGMNPVNSTTMQEYPNCSVFTPHSREIDEKLRAKIHAGEFIKLSLLLPKDFTVEEEEKFKSVEQDGQLVFLKSKDRDSIKTIGKWMDAFHIFVAIYAEKFPHETGSLMAYAQTIRNLAETCGVQAALNYDERFRRWRQQDPTSCQWQTKNVELFQDAILKGLDNKINNSKPQQPFRKKHRYCFTFNNHGSCRNGNSCPHPHVCQYCAGKHPRKVCHKSRHFGPREQGTKGNSKSSTNNPTKQ